MSPCAPRDRFPHRWGADTVSTCQFMGRNARVESAGLPHELLREFGVWTRLTPRLPHSLNHVPGILHCRTDTHVLDIDAFSIIAVMADHSRRPHSFCKKPSGTMGTKSSTFRTAHAEIPIALRVHRASPFDTPTHTGSRAAINLKPIQHASHVRIVAHRGVPWQH